MILFKSYRRLFHKFFERLDNRDAENRKNILLELEKISLKETVEYVQEYMHATPALSSSFEVYDYVLKQLEVKNGLYCEFGVWKGTSINYIAKRIQSNIHGFDSFEGLPEFWRGGYTEEHFSLKGNLPQVENNVVLYQGWFEDTLPAFVQTHTNSLSLLHIDCDLYSSTKTIFKFLGDRIIPGTIIIFDEYFNFPFWKKHEYKAFQEFIGQSGYKYEYLCYNQLHEQVAVKITSN